MQHFHKLSIQVLENDINKLNQIIRSIKKEYKDAVAVGKPFYITKEMLQRLKLAQNLLEELKEQKKRRKAG